MARAAGEMATQVFRVAGSGSGSGSGDELLNFPQFYRGRVAFAGLLPSDLLFSQRA